MRVGRVIAIILGLGFLLFGGLMLLMSSVGLWAVGWSSTLDTGYQKLDTPTSALYFGVEDLGGDWLTDWPMNDKEKVELTIEARTEGEESLFVGFGPTGDVERYLGDGPYDELEAFSDSPSSDATGIETKRRGSGEPKALPTPDDQDIWAQSSEPGEQVKVEWDFQKDGYSAVLMNADGSPDVKTETKFRLHIPNLNVIFLVWIVISAVLVLLGLFLLFKVGRRRPAMH